MKSLLPIALVACGGSKPKPAPPPPAPEPPHATRVPIEDTEPDDGVEVVAAHGHMDPAVVEAGIAPYKSDLEDCFTGQAGNRRWLGGKVTLHWDVMKNGDVHRVMISESDLGAWPIEKCLLEVARKATFGKPIGGKAEFTIPLEFAARGPFIDWQEDQIKKALGTQLQKLAQCRTKVPSGVTITLYVGPRGTPQSVGFGSARSVIDEAWADCAEKAALAWRLTDPKGIIAKLAIKYR